MSLPQFKLLRPRTLDEALSHLAKHSDRVAPADLPTHNLRIVAGGTDLIPSMRQKLFEPEYLSLIHI